MSQQVCTPCKNTIYEHYEKQWEGYTVKDVFTRVNNLSSILDSILSSLSLKKGTRILDLGSGPAIIPIRLAQTIDKNRDIMTYGIDISDKALKLGINVVETSEFKDIIHLLKGQCENLPFKDSIFDYVVSNATLNLLPDKEKGFNEIARVTKVGGEIAIGDCIARKEKPNKNQSCDDKLWNVCVEGAPMFIEMQEMAKRSGLKIIKTYDLTDKVSHLVNKRLWDWPEFLEYNLEYHIFRMLKTR